MIHWLWLGAASAVLLGLYDLSKKSALQGNAVLPVLFFTSLSSLGVVGVQWGIARFAGTELLPHLGPADHLALAAKSLLVTISWLFTYRAVKHLPLSTSGPLRASAPLFTLAGAVLLFAERPTGLQWLGIGTVLLGYWGFAWAGRRGGERLHRDRWVLWMLAGTAFGAASGLYDKELLQRRGYDPFVVQFWFSFYNTALQGALAGWVALRERGTPLGTWSRFRWRWSIVLTGVLLVAADRAWFEALHQQGAMISVLTVVRRTSVVLSFLAGVLLLRESNWRRKGAALMVILGGLSLLVLGR